METLMVSVWCVGQGLGLTLALLCGSVVLGLTLAVVWAICRHQSMASGLINPLISVIRGTPLMLQLSLIYFSLPPLTGIHPSILCAGIMTLGLNCSAYVAEILRSGIESLPKGQFEAALTLQIPAFYVWRDIILPQVLKAIFPAMVNQVIALLKETALISTIGGMDVMRQAESLAAEQFTYFIPLCIAGGYYYGFVLLIEACGKHIEKRGAYVSNKASL